MSRVIILNNLIRFEPEKKNLSSQDAHVHISAPASYCFQLLIEKQGELVTHEELYQYAWRQFGMEATANTLYQNISVIRRGLDKCGLNEDIIRTMPRRGFIFSSAVVIQYARAQDYTDTEEINTTERTAAIPKDLDAEHNFKENYCDESVTHSDYHDGNQRYSEFDTEKPRAEILSETLNEKREYFRENDSFTAKPEEFQFDSTENRIHGRRKTKRDRYFLYHNQGNKCLKSTLNELFFSNAFLVFSTVSLVSSILYVLVSLNFDSNLGSIPYHYTATYNECNYYLQRDADNDARTISIIYSLSQRCHSHKFKYITKFIEGDMMSIISCRRKMDYFSVNNCISEYIMVVGND